MTISGLLVSLCVCQDPSLPQGAPADALRRDVVELRNGELLEGRIVLERGNYLEIELGPGATVGFRTTEIKEVRRGAGEPVAAAANASLAFDEWYTLHDAAGRPVGWLHSAAVAGEGGGVRLSEEWEFSEGRRHFQVTMLETADAQLRPVSDYFRERVSDELEGVVPDDPLGRSSRVHSERIVEARVDGAVLHTARLRTEGREERDLPWPEGATFPLLARQRHLAAHTAIAVPVFDPAIEELTAREFPADRQRTVAIDGRSVPVTETVESSSTGHNATWLDASAHVLRREISGPSLVAMPSTAELARGAVARGTALPAAFAAEAGGRFGLWRPNPAWEVVPAAEGAVALRCELHDATISLSVLDHLDKGTTLAAAADAVERWFRLLQPGARVEPREWIKVRDRDALQLQAKGRNGDRAEGAVLVVVPWQDVFLVLRCSAPARALEELKPDFAAVIAHLELDSKAVTALLPSDGGRQTVAAAHAPAAGRTARAAAAPAVTVPAPETAPPAAPPDKPAGARERHSVRVPHSEVHK